MASVFISLHCSDLCLNFLPLTSVLAEESGEEGRKGNLYLFLYMHSFSK